MIRELLKFLAVVYKRLKLHWWDFAIDKDKIINLEVLRHIYFRFKGIGDIARILYSDQHVVKFKKSFEYKTLDMFQSFLKEGDVVIDVGANIGLFSLLGSKYIGENGKVYAFEPTQETYEILKSNIKLNAIENIIPHQIPLADKVMPIVMVNPSKKNDNYHDAFNRIQEIEDENKSNSVLFTKSFDDFADENGLTRIDFVKVDIEGAELLFFKGAHHSLSRFRPKIIFEANEKHCQAFNYQVVDILVYLKDLGYDLKQISEEQWLAT